MSRPFTFTAKAVKIGANWANIGAWTDGIGVYTDYDISPPLIPGKTYKVTIEEVSDAVESEVPAVVR